MSTSSTDRASRRSTFRRRLVLSQGLVLALAFLIIGVLCWLATFGWLHYHAWTLLEEEAQEINFHIVGLDGELAPERYAWYEPHHLYREPRLDPYFAQVFDLSGDVIHASSNTRLFLAPFPDTLVTYSTSAFGTFSVLNTLTIDDSQLYFGNYPIIGRNGRKLGTLQIARYEPNIPGRLKEIAVGLSIGLIVLLFLLLFLTDRVAVRALGPLTSITRFANALSPNRMDERIPIPAEADWETTRLAETLNALLDRLEGALENMRRFTSNAAHELQTPLTVLRGHVEISLRRPRTPEAYQATLHTLAGEIDGMSRTIRSLLTLARLERGRVVLAGGFFDLSELIREETVPFARLAREKGLSWTEDLQTPALMKGHPDLMRDVIRNVLENALKFTQKGGIAVSTKVDGDRIAFTVNDSGIGIDSESLPFVTERFFRVESAQGAGSGLGLSLVDQIVALHDGSLEISSRPSVGTTVRIHFPRMPDDPTPSGDAHRDVTHPPEPHPSLA
ncbi:MAG: HAMP domain-containing sensor histidine kinase [Rhodothermales bacterium]